MTTINLREQYPDYYKTDTYIIVSDEVAEAMLAGSAYPQTAPRRWCSSSLTPAGISDAATPLEASSF